MGKYEGDSYPKKEARAFFWHTAKSAFDAQAHDCVKCRPKGPTCLVVSGPEGFDVQSAVSRGISPDCVTAVDLDSAAIRSAKERQASLAGVEWIVGDVTELLATRNFDIVFLDMCMTTERVAKLLLDSLTANKGKASQVRRVKGGCDEAGYVSIVGAGGMYGRDGLKTPVYRMPGPYRIERIQRQMVLAAARSGASYQPLLGYVYHSARKRSAGVPMAYAAGTLLTSPVNDRLGRRRATKHARACLRNFEKEINRGSPPFSFMHFPADVEGGAVRNLLVHMVRKNGYDPDTVSRWFCVERKTLAAWMAHDTMGTYRDRDSRPANKKTILYRREWEEAQRRKAARGE